MENKKLTVLSYSKPKTLVILNHKTIVNATFSPAGEMMNKTRYPLKEDKICWMKKEMQIWNINLIS